MQKSHLNKLLSLTILSGLLFAFPLPTEAVDYTFTKIADSAQFTRGFEGHPAINNRGSVAFKAFLNTGGDGVVTGDGGPLTKIADTTGSFGNLGDLVRMNERGTVAFMASLNTGGFGIFTGPDTITNKVIATGDSLFGSTVTFVAHPVINDPGQVAFRVSLADGTTSIVRADPRH